MKSGWVFPPESWIFLKLACSVHTPCPLRKLGPRARRSLSLSSASWLPKQHPSLLSPTASEKRANSDGSLLLPKLPSELPGTSSRSSRFQQEQRLKIGLWKHPWLN